MNFCREVREPVRVEEMADRILVPLEQTGHLDVRG